MIETRPIQESDHAGIMAVVETLHDVWFNDAAYNHDIPSDLRHQHGFVALADGEAVGFITLFFAEGKLNIGWLGVRRERRGEGIGSQLLAAAEEFGRQHGMTEIATYTVGDGVDYEPYEATRAFYFRRGFTVYQRNNTDNPDCPEEIKLKKRIT
jgi:GNAT superfamily N-acetyltransferase